MINNFIRIAFRNLWRNRVFSFINITGLAVGLTACFLIFLYVSFELSYDKFHSKSDRIYRVLADVKTPTETIYAGITSWPMAPNIKVDFPEVESFVRFQRTSMLVRKDEKKFEEDGIAYADSTFFKLFDFPLLRGHKETVLKEPFSIVLSESAAKKYFGTADPVGQTLLLSSSDFAGKVTGVMKNIPENSHVKAHVILSMTTLTQVWNPTQDEQWSNFDAVSYLLLKPGVDPTVLERKLPDFLVKRNGKEMEQNKMFYELHLEPLKDVYMNAERQDNIENGNRSNISIFSIVALFILLIACINFVNLTTARSVERAKEVGVRKVVGAEKSQLVQQFLGESLLQTLFAFVLAVILSSLLLPLFNNLAGKTISSGILTDAQPVLLLFVSSLVIGVIAGFYPALVLSSFNPIVVLKGRFSTSSKGIILRKGLVVAQFTISIALIIGTIVVYYQMKYMRGRDLGFAKDQMLVVDAGGGQLKTFKNEIASIPTVKSVAMGSTVPGGSHSKAYSEIENVKGELQIANVDLFFVDYDYIDVFKIQMVAGRPFSTDFATDSTEAMILNEAAVKLFGYASPQGAVGKRFKQWGREGKIIGVAKNFHYKSLQEAINPLSMRIEPLRFGLLAINVAGENLPATIAAIEKKFSSVDKKRPFNYYFVDEFFDRQYRSEERFGKLFFNFAILAIFISCLGLLGLASYTTIQRTKEIGVRKVLGASVSSIIHLLSKDFLQLVVFSFALATPIAWYFMNKWLEDFAYRADISWWIFIAAGLSALFIALVTISFQAVRAAVANPVKSLRTE